MNTTVSHQKDLLQLSSTLSKMLKRTFGKGPETCYITQQSNRLTVYIRNFTTPSEEVLIESSKIGLAYNFRYSVVEKVLHDFKQEAEDVLDIPFTTYYSDWDYQSNTGLVIFENEEDLFESIKSNEKLLPKLSEKIRYVGSKVHKDPDNMNVRKLNQNLYAVECEGTMLQIEKVLYEKDRVDLLHERSREIKENYLRKKEVFEVVFDREIEGLFMTWDYKNDRSHIFFYLQ